MRPSLSPTQSPSPHPTPEPTPAPHLPLAMKVPVWDLSARLLGLFLATTFVTFCCCLAYVCYFCDVEEEDERIYLDLSDKESSLSITEDAPAKFMIKPIDMPDDYEVSEMNLIDVINHGDGSLVGGKQLTFEDLKKIGDGLSETETPIIPESFSPEPERTPESWENSRRWLNSDHEAGSMSTSVSNSNDSIIISSESESMFNSSESTFTESYHSHYI